MKKCGHIFISMIFIFINFSYFITENAFGMKKVAQSGMQYLKVGVDAQMVGRGEAGISLTNGLQSVFWNPAGLAEIKGKSAFFSHNSWIADISLDACAYGMDLGNWGAIAFNAVWVDYGELLGTSVAQTVEESSEQGYVDEGTFQPIDLAFGMAYARKISSQFSIGGQIRYLYEHYGSNEIVTTEGNEVYVENEIGTLCFDLGTRYYTNFKGLAFSMTIQNFSTDIKYHWESFSPPLTFKIGISMDLLELVNDQSRSHLLLAIDALHPRDYSERVNLGLEYDYLGMFMLRSGYRYNYDEGNFTLGGGLRYSFCSGLRLRFDMSYLVMTADRFNSPLQITVGIDF